jgi:hypothetical protein
MVHYNKWFISEIGDKVYKARFVDHGWTYSDMEVRIRERVKIIPKFIEFWIWIPWVTFKIHSNKAISRSKYYTNDLALELLKETVSSMEFYSKSNMEDPNNPPHSKFVGDGGRISKINQILGS